jgi:TonB-dependent siderophore receptor
VERVLIAALLSALIAAHTAQAADSTSADAGDAEPGRNRGEFVEYVEVRDASIPTSNTIATKLSQPLQRTPAHVGTVAEPLIYEQSARVLTDALENVSGLNVMNGSGVHDYFTIRGFDVVSSGLVMTDGAEEPAITYYPTYNVRAIEVLKGPAGFLYGKNPLAGAVNIVRKQPLDGSFAVFGGSVGSFATRRGTIDWNEATGDARVRFRLNGMWDAAENYRERTDSRHVAFNPGIAVELSESAKLNLNVEYTDARYGPDNGLPLVRNAIPDVPRWRSYQGTDDFSEQSLGRVQVDFETRLHERVALRNKTYYRGLDWRTDGTLLQTTTEDPPWLQPGEVQVVRDLGVLDDRQVFIGNQLEAVVGFASGGVEHDLLAGVEIVRETDRYTFAIDPLPDVELSSLEQTQVDLGTPPLDPSVGDVTNRIVAPYVVDRMQLSRRVELVLGARYDMIDVDGDVTPLGSSTPLAFTRDDSELSPMAGLLVAPDPTLSIYVNAARSYAPPSTRLVDEADPASREPERGTQLELGVKKQFRDGRYRTTFALYELERDRIAIADATGFRQQSGNQLSRGVEVELAAEPLPGLRAFLAYAYNDAELTEFTRFDPWTMTVQDLSGNRPILTPEHLLNLWVGKSCPAGFGVAGGVRFIDEQFISEDNLFAIDSALVFDTTFLYERNAWRFNLTFENLTDARYETRGIAGASSVIPADPFTVRAGVEYRLR